MQPFFYLDDARVIRPIFRERHAGRGYFGFSQYKPHKGSRYDFSENRK